MARVLIADDAAFMRMMIKNILTQNGHEVVGEAENGEEAVEQYAELKPDVRTMDITMPEKDGIAALKEIIATDPSAKRRDVLGPRPGGQGDRVDPVRREGLHREAVPAGPRPLRRHEGPRLMRRDVLEVPGTRRDIAS